MSVYWLPPPRHRVPIGVGCAAQWGVGCHCRNSQHPSAWELPQGLDSLVGPGPGREQRKRPCRQVGVSPAVISTLASCQPQFLSPSPWAEAVYLRYEEAEEGSACPGHRYLSWETLHPASSN